MTALRQSHRSAACVEARRADAQQIIEAAFDALDLLVIDSDHAGNVVAISLNGVLTSVRPTWLNGLHGGEWGLLISVETSVKLDHLLKAGVVTMLQSAGTLLADCATAIGGDAHGRILLHRVLALAHLTVDHLAAVISSTQHLRQLLDASPERSALPA
ncbi:hypothetical protein PQQ51_01890 [Paraburkholderia xenovorans]|uniref:hypothetical protein n=1 Tax=Paraburkholderia xenovorans TaxID=36873 RepID=UPI0038BC3319